MITKPDVPLLQRLSTKNVGTVMFRWNVFVYVPESPVPGVFNYPGSV
jgi:hypothetical protein